MAICRADGYGISASLDKAAAALESLTESEAACVIRVYDGLRQGNSVTSTLALATRACARK